MSRVFLRAGHSPQRRDWLAGHVRFELRNVGANYPFEKVAQISGDPAEFRPQRLFAFELRRWEAQLGLSASISAGCLRWQELPRFSAGQSSKTIAHFALDFFRKESVCGGHGQQAWLACPRLRRLYPFHIRRKRTLISIGSLGG